jgi:hypothetical protein
VITQEEEINVENETVIEDVVTEEIEASSLDPFTDESLNYYEIDVVLDTEAHTLKGTEKITFTNTEGLDLSEVYLHLYPNAFTKENHPSLFDTGVDEINEQYGYVTIDSVVVNGTVVDHTIEPIDTVMKISYDFMDMETYEIEIEMTIGISTTSERFGVVRGLYNLGNWYPVLAVYDHEGWNLDPYYSIGDPFYSDMANYDVQINVPLGYEVAASGYLVELGENESLNYAFRGDRMRDFAMVISEDFKVIPVELENTTVYLYYPEFLEGHNWLLDAVEFGSGSIDFFSDYIGPYPYKTYSVVITNFPSGMEYPGIVFISDKYFDGNIDSLRTVIVHETVHQWFYNIIGDDSIEEGWIDEGLTSFFTAFYDRETNNRAYYKGTIDYYENRMESYGPVTILKSAAEYADWGEYGVAAYTTPAVLYNDLLVKFGDEKMSEFAKLLFEKYAYKHIYYEDLKETVFEVYGQEGVTMMDSLIK